MGSLGEVGGVGENLKTQAYQVVSEIIIVERYCIMGWVVETCRGEREREGWKKKPERKKETGNLTAN